MTEVRAAVIAAGSQGRVHAFGYQQLPNVRVVAIADVDRALARSAAGAFEIPSTYADHIELLDLEQVDVLSICTPPAHHRAIVEAAIARGVRAIHCEKPMAMTFGDARWMDTSARRHATRLTINHQRRLDPLHGIVRQQLAAGAIGDIVAIDATCANLFDWGSHIVDLMRLYRDDRPVESVLAGVGVSSRKHVYGALTETESITHLRWSDGVNGTILTGGNHEHLSLMGGNGMVVQGTTGRVDIVGGRAILHRDGSPAMVIEPQVDARYRVDLGGAGAAIIAGTALALAELVDSLDRPDRELTLDSRHGLAAAEVVFAAYQSGVLRARVDLPLDVDDNPLIRGLDAGLWQPVGETWSTF